MENVKKHYTPDNYLYNINIHLSIYRICPEYFKIGFSAFYPFHILTHFLGRLTDFFVILTKCQMSTYY